jgi:hypothetical protein
MGCERRGGSSVHPVEIEEDQPVRFVIHGVHPVETREPCHLIEVVLPKDEKFDWGKVTQEKPKQPRENLQVAYDEQPVDEAANRWVFFFHYLDVNKPLMTPLGKVRLPAPTTLPERLASIKYYEP